MTTPQAGRRLVPAAVLLIVSCAASLAVAALVAAPAAWAGTSYPPIPPGPATGLPDWIGAAATPQPVAASIPQNPSLAPNPFSYLHNDSWNSDVFSVWAPLGSDPQVTTSTLGAAVTGGRQMTTAMGTDTYGRLVAVKIDGSGSYLLLIDPESLEVLTSYKLGSGSTSAMGSAYWYLDPKDRVTVVSGTAKVMTLRETGTLLQPGIDLVKGRQWDLSTLQPSPVKSGDKLNGLMADWRGRVWFQTAGTGARPGTEGAPRVGVIVPSKWPTVKWIALGKGEEIWNGFAVTKTGTYVLTSEKLYRLRAGDDGRPRVVWSVRYQTTGQTPPGQYSLGSGTSPAILGGGKYVTIADNAAQEHVVVYRTAARLKRGQHRRVGIMPVFTGMAGQAVENSLLAAGRSIIAENNYGYAWSFDQDGDMSSTSNLPGIQRVDIRKGGSGLVKVWENDDIAAMTTPKLSTKTGLVYLLARTKDEDTSADVYYWTALDFRTGQVVWQKLAGTGQAYDNYWAGPAVGRNGAVYVGCYGGLVAIKDGVPK